MAGAEELIRQPHGREQQVKMEIVSMIHGGEPPYDVIYHVAQWLEKASGEPGYAQYVLDAMRAVYGCALQHVRPMEDELRDVAPPTRTPCSRRRRRSGSALRSTFM